MTTILCADVIPALRPLMVISIAVTAFVFVFPTVLADFGPGPLFFYRLLLFPADITLALSAILSGIVALGQRVRPGSGTTLLGIFTACLALAWVVHPSPQGVQIVVRLAGATGLALGISMLRRDERVLVVATLAVATALQLGLAVAQLIACRPLGLPSFGEVADPLLVYVGVCAPRGTMHGQYLLAGLGLIATLLLVRESLSARRPLLWIAGAALSVIAVSLTLSRAAALAVGLSLVALMLGSRERRRDLTIAASAVGGVALIAALGVLPGWAFKASTGLSPEGREILVAESSVLIPQSPIIGIGPGRTVIVLLQQDPGHPYYYYQPAHGLPLVATVEGGVIAGAASVLLLVALAWRARSDVRALALYFAFLPVLLTDQYPYDYLQGAVMFGIWVGALDALLRDGEAIPLNARLSSIGARVRRDGRSTGTSRPVAR